MRKIKLVVPVARSDKHFSKDPNDYTPVMVEGWRYENAAGEAVAITKGVGEDEDKWFVRDIPTGYVCHSSGYTRRKDAEYWADIFIGKLQYFRAHNPELNEALVNVRLELEKRFGSYTRDREAQ